MMWSSSSNSFSGGFKKRATGPTSWADCSDDEEVSSCASKGDSLECPICWESFNLVENVPYILWCGHTMCKNCILGLRWATVKLPALPVQLPFFIACPWCNILSFRLIYKGNLKFPRKNYFLLWMVQGMNGERSKSHETHAEHQLLSSASNQHNCNCLSLVSDSPGAVQPTNSQTAANNATVPKLMRTFVLITSKLPLVLLFTFIIVYAIPASAAVLALYALATVLFAVPSVLILYFAYPSLEWLVREIFT